MECLSSSEQRALEEDLKLASRIQNALLPRREIKTGDWEVSYLYESAGVTGGDYCDLLLDEDGAFHFVLGDVSGKGVAASLLMSHLHASFRTLVSMGVPLPELVERVNTVFSEITLPNHFATMIYGRADREGGVRIANAGHLPPLMLKQGRILDLPATGIPLGMRNGERYDVHRLSLDRGDSLLLYTDGLTEARDASGAEYGDAPLRRLIGGAERLSPQALIDAVCLDLEAFCGGGRSADDLTIMAIRRSPEAVGKTRALPAPPHRAVDSR